MSDTINDGGQAFPTHPILYGSADQHLAQGMSLRAYVAAQCMAGFCSMHDEAGLWSWDVDDAARTAVSCADALIAELAKGGAQ